MENYNDSSDSGYNTFTYRYDILKKQVIEDCSLNPTEVTQDEVEWLYAINNKYEDYDSKKVGKWMIFPSKDEVDSIWNKIKEAIKTGDIWQSKVYPANPQDRYAIMIYTKDYSDRKDVIDVLNYLETSGIKPANSIIKYKTNEQTRAGIYSGGTHKSSIYVSTTIRDEYTCNRTGTSNDNNLYTFTYDILKEQIINDCYLNPTEITREETDWLYARNNKYEDYDSKKVGKWMIFPSKDDLNTIWNKVKEGIKAGALWKSTVSTANPAEIYIIMIFTKDYTDKKDVIDVLNYLEMSGIKPENTVIKYKTNAQTRAGITAGGTPRSSIYASHTIKEEYTCSRTGTSNDYMLYTFTYDILKKHTIDDCSLNPTEIPHKETEWLHAVNNKYDYKVDSLKVGKWILFPSKNDVNSIWNKVKEGIKAGDLWKSKVSTFSTAYTDNYIIMIFTKNYADKKDVIDVLNYLEVSGIKPENTIIKYKTNEQTRASSYSGGTHKFSIYVSNTIRDEYACNRTETSNDNNLYTFTYDILKEQIINDCYLNPTEITQEETDWLYARNNKYKDYDSKKVGKWMIFPSKDNLNTIWNKVKEGIKAGDLWKSKVSTTNPNRYVIMIFTKDYTDRKDVVDVLNYLEMSGIKQANTIIKYKTNEQTRASITAGGTQRPSIYASNTIRKNCEFYGNKNAITNWRTPSGSGATTSSNTSHP